jgi:hypothetical protein
MYVKYSIQFFNNSGIGDAICMMRKYVVDGDNVLDIDVCKSQYYTMLNARINVDVEDYINRIFSVPNHKTEDGKRDTVTVKATFTVCKYGFPEFMAKLAKEIEKRMSGDLPDFMIEQSDDHSFIDSMNIIVTTKSTLKEIKEYIFGDLELEDGW